MGISPFLKTSSSISEFTMYHELVSLVNFMRRKGNSIVVLVIVWARRDEQLWEVYHRFSQQSCCKEEDWYLPLSIIKRRCKIVEFRFESTLRRRSEAENQG